MTIEILMGTQKKKPMRQTFYKRPAGIILLQKTSTESNELGGRTNKIAANFL